MPLDVIAIVSRIVHVTTAIVLVGGSAFSLFALAPALAGMSEDVRRSVAEAVGQRWKRFVHIGVVLFLVSGLYNYMQAIGNHRGDSLYHALLGIKMLAALIVFFIAAALVGRTPRLEPIRQQRQKWLGILVALAMLIVAISGFVKVRGIPTASTVVAPVSADMPVAGEMP